MIGIARVAVLLGPGDKEGLLRPIGTQPDWDALVRSRATLAIYMGMQRLAHIVARLLAAGLAPATPVAVISQGTLPEQREVRATVATIVPAVARARLQAPALIVVGDVVALGAEGISSTSQAGQWSAQRVQPEPSMEATQS